MTCTPFIEVKNMLSIWWTGFIVPAVMIVCGLLRFPKYKDDFLTDQQKRQCEILHHKLLWQGGTAMVAVTIMLMGSVVRMPESAQRIMVYVLIVMEAALALLLRIPVLRTVCSEETADRTAVEEAPAKLNLTLEVGKKRPDNYHEVRTVMTVAALTDTITVTVGEGNELSMVCDAPGLACDESNLCLRAAKAFLAHIGREQSVYVELVKCIPMQAGLGGGSADAAAVLRALRTLLMPEMPMEELAAIGASIGSDVPFCVMGGTMVGSGRGEILTPAPPMALCYLLIAKPKKTSCDTGAMYRQIDDKGILPKATTDLLLAALEAGDLQGVCIQMNNSFHDLLEEEHPSRKACEIMVRSGALGAQLSGSGSAVFGVFDSEKKARVAFDSLLKLCGSEVFLCQNV